MKASRAPRLSQISRLSLALALASVSACTTAGPKTVRAGPSAEPADSSPAAPDAPDAITVLDVAQLEVERATPSVFEEALQLAQPPAVRARSALALARAEHTEAIAGLLLAVGDEHAVVRRHGYFGLGQLDLALVEGLPSHDDRRSAVEQVLVRALDEEKDRAARLAVVRALGRVAVGSGLDRLVTLASSNDELRAEALYALGVSGARRNASRTEDPGVLGAVRLGLVARDVEVRRAAAYAAFRQKLPLPVDDLARIAKEPDAQTRIHLARALKERLADAAPALPLLDDEDWRVRVEVIRALEALSSRGGGMPIAAVHAAMTKAADALVAAARAGGEVHVVTTGCGALSSPEAATAPDEVRPLLLALVDKLKAGGPRLLPAACACAAAVDALDAQPHAVRTCGADSWPAERRRRLEVEVASRARISARERAVWLKTALSDPAPEVRSAAAWALVADGSPHAAEVAAAQLELEEDPAVAGALLLLFQGQNEDALTDATLARVVDRFTTAAHNLEEAEPLLQAALIARERSTPSAKGALERLLSHPEPRVRELAGRVPHGERTHGPRARPKLAPPLSQLPLGAIVHTDRGAIRIEFERELAPIAVANFASLAHKGFFDGTRFHRVVPDFVAQGGDPRGDGSGGPGYNIVCENHDERYTRGAVGMALAGKDTGGSQFFFTHSEQPHLDGRYTLFARVVEGLEVMDALTQEDRIVSVELMGAVPAR